jgi:ribonuclease T2
MYRRFLLALAVAVFSASAYADFQRCIISNDLPATRSVRIDWQNNTRQFDYYALALSWSPQHCANPRNRHRHRFQCQTNRFTFVVHGLWPQSASGRSKFDHPRHCASGPLLSQELIKKHICTVPGVYLMQAQWSKHGSCAFNKPAAYFKQIETLKSGLKLPDLRSGRRNHDLTVRELTDLVTGLNSKQGMKREHIKVWVNRRGFLREIVVCYDRNFKFTRCLVRGAPQHYRVKIRLN